MMGLHIAIYQHEQILKKLCPNLARHLEEHGVGATMYASQWFLTFFSYSFPLPLVFRIFDIMILENALITMIRFSISILKRNEQLLLQCDSIESIIALTKGKAIIDIYEVTCT
jgi:Rab-GTPase-TBC domain